MLEDLVVIGVISWFSEELISNLFCGHLSFKNTRGVIPFIGLLFSCALYILGSIISLD